jgi:RES domain-containing protein
MNLGAIRSLLPGIPTPTNTYFRVVSDAFAASIDDIWPSFHHGWRFNPKNEFGVLYLAISKRCCSLERLRQFRGDERGLAPLIVGEFKVNIARCLDLTSTTFLKKLGITTQELLSEDFALPQSVAREARSAGFEAIIAPSAASEECQNLVVFKDRLTPPSFCLLSKTHRLA